MKIGLLRLHVYTSPVDELDSARFIASALLTSHGIRREAAAAVFLREAWLVARGDRVRHLRPDEETLEGWLKAVLRGKTLGAEVSEKPPEPLKPVVCVSSRGDRTLADLLSIGEPATLVYGAPLYDCDYTLSPGVDAPAFALAAIANILLDNSRLRDSIQLSRRALDTNNVA